MSQNDFKIIRILSDTEFVINGGTANEIQINDKFKIVDPDANPLQDLDGSTIGYLGAEKEVLIAGEVHDTFSILRTDFVPATKPYSSVTVQGGMVGSVRGFVASQQAVGTPAHYKRAKIDPSEMEPIDETDEPIRKGDTAIKI